MVKVTEKSTWNENRRYAPHSKQKAIVRECSDNADEKTTNEITWLKIKQTKIKKKTCRRRLAVLYVFLCIITVLSYTCDVSPTRLIACQSGLNSFLFYSTEVPRARPSCTYFIIYLSPTQHIDYSKWIVISLFSACCIT